MVRPNILLICTDQHRADVVGSYGNQVVQTPAIDALAGTGVRFASCYTPSPVCAPARASMVTGRYPRSHGLWANGVSLPADAPMASAELARSGYECGFIGKLHLSACYEGRTEARRDDGFEFVRWAHDPAHGAEDNAYHNWLRRRHPRLWSDAMADRLTPAKGETHEATPFHRMPTEAHYSTWVAEEAVGFLRDRGKSGEVRPFFLWVNFFDPHHPFVAPKEYLAEYGPGSVPPPIGGPEDLRGRPPVLADASKRSYNGAARGFAEYSATELDEARRGYYAQVSLADSAIGDVLAALEDSGLAGNTLVIFTSDHGEMLGDHGLMLKGPMMYEGAVRVPLIMKWPDQLPEGDTITDMASTHDLARTMLAAAGLSPLPGDEGMNLLDVARREQRGRGFAVCEYRDSGHPYDPPVHTTMYRTQAHKLVLWHGGVATDRDQTGELYDLVIDPDERLNRWDDSSYQDVKARLLGSLLDLWVSTEDRSQVRDAPW